ncbi:MAG: efflux transporter outer membrane subunit [Kiritimatiellae bacterium]|nr:efflux transporter outer membrane subunit [Kiritimatiellia bacterium]
MNSRPHFPFSIHHSPFSILHFPFAAALLLAGCAVGPDYTPPSDGGIPEAFVSRRDWTSGKEDFYILVSCGRGAEPDEIGFFALGDKRLATLQAIAATNNLTVLQAAQRIEASRAALAGSRAEFWPNVGFSAGTSKAKNYNPDGSSERSSLGFDASWEIDLFGKVRRSVEAAQAEFEATEYSLDDAMLSLRAEIAAEYVNFCLRHQLWKIAMENFSHQEEFLKIAEEKFEAGMGAEFDYQTAQAQRYSAMASVDSAQSDMEACVRRLERLCSLPPCAMSQFSGLTELKMPALPDVPMPEFEDYQRFLTVQSDVMRNRPDIRRTEREYAAALACVGVSKANYFPSVSIGVGISVASDAFASWEDAMRSISFGPSLNWSLLSFGRTKAKMAQARAKAEEAALAYREAVLAAYHEIEDSIVVENHHSARENLLKAALERQRKAEEMARKSYEEGLGEYRDLLSASQTRLSTERSLAEARANRILERIALAKALAL